MTASNGIMEALTEARINIIGVYGLDSSERASLLEKISRKAKRDYLFKAVAKATVTKKPDLKRFQDKEEMLSLELDKKKDVAERALCFCGKIEEQHKNFVVLDDLWKSPDLNKVGIRFGADHNGCKRLLTSTNEEVLFNKMHTQQNFNV